MDEEKLLKKKKNNIKIYKIYRIFSFDLLFYFTTIYLFLISQKGMSPADVLQFDAFYILFKFIVQIPCTLLIQKFGKRNSLAFANLVGVIHIILIIIAPNYGVLILSQLLCAITFVVRSTCETDMLYDSLEHNEERGHKFAKIDGRANAIYYYAEAISALISGFLYVLNPFIPMILCTVTLFVAFILSLKFEEIHTEKKKMHIKEEIKTLRLGGKAVMRSRRLMCLVLFNALSIGMIKIVQNIRNTELLEVGLPEQYFGIVFAIFALATGISARCQGRIHKRFKNKTLSILSLPTATAILLSGIVILFDIPVVVSVIIVAVLLMVNSMSKGPFMILIKRYLNNFTNSEKRVRIATVNNMFENAIASALIFGASLILGEINIAYTAIFIGGCFIITYTLLLDYMKTKVGLKPEEYSDREILKND
ncbi:MAG: MFS transporter [Clostridia bacterium]|nr:MFS transporter [Clostridia bacterium]